MTVVLPCKIICEMLNRKDFLKIIYKIKCIEYLVIYKLYETGPVDRCKMRRKSDCSGLMAFQAQQRQKQQQQPQLLVISKNIEIIRLCLLFSVYVCQSNRAHCSRLATTRQLIFKVKLTVEKIWNTIITLVSITLADTSTL